MAAEDDEIDILGDFSLDDCINKNEKNVNSTYSDLLKCDYSVHPQWLLDTVTTANWYDNPPQEDNIMKNDAGNFKNYHSDDDGHPSTSAGVVEWTIYEKELLKKAMDIYGRDYNRIAIFLGSKSMQDVKMLIEAEYGINLENEPSKSIPQDIASGSHLYGDVLTEHEIPASIEEVICMVSTGEPTVPDIKNTKVNAKDNPRSVLRKNVATNQNRSLLKKSILYPNATTSNALTKKQNAKILLNKKSPKLNDSSIEDSKRNIQSNYELDKDLKLKKSNSFDSKKIIQPLNKRIRKSLNSSKFNISLMMNKKDGFSQLPGRRKKAFTCSKRREVRLKSVSEASEPIIEKTVMQIVTGSGQALPLFEGEQVIKIEKNTNSEAESDIEVDIDSDDDAPIKITTQSIVTNSSKKTIFNSTIPVTISETSLNIESKIEPDTEECSQINVDTQIVDIPEDIKDIVLSMDIPQEEYMVVLGEITNLEKFLCPEFFEGRSAKTPERYMIIRTHLVQSWRTCKPQYLTKTAARHGLRNCGDVNCIGKVHTLMEQLGAINFECEQTNYIRPLSLLLTRSAPLAVPPATLSSKAKQTEDFHKSSSFRQRKKKIVVDGEGGYTITHSEFGETCEAVGEPKHQRAVKKKHTNLIYCKSFSHDHPAPFSVTISLSALVLMDFHSHTSHAEVMGLLGGHYNPHEANLHVQYYVPCDSLEDSGTHCDMCPVSQSEAGEVISALGMETVGWHHSHPLFPPWPSPQDLLTQQDLQAALSPTPCLAIILSPYWQPGRTSSQYRCLYVKRDSSSSETLAFRFKTLIDCDLVLEGSVENLMQNIKRILEKKEKLTGNYFVDMKNDICPNAQVSYLDKCVSSISHHLKSCENQMGVTRCKHIINCIRNLIR